MDKAVVSNENTAQENIGVASASVKLSTKECIAYGFGNAGGIFMFTLMLSFLMMFWSDVLLIPMGVVGIFMLVNKIWDAVNDPIIGWLADRTNTKYGRYRPWLFSFIAVTIFGFCCFVKLPNASPTAQAVFTFTAYFLYILGFTSFEIPHVSLMSTMTTSFEARGILAGYRQTIGQVIMLIIMVGFTPVAMKLGGGDLNKGMTSTVAICAVLSLPFFLICFFGVKERVKPSKTTEHTPIKESFKCLKGNTPALSLMFAHLIWGASVGCTAGTRMFFWQYVANDMGHVSINMLCFSGGMTLGAFGTSVLIRWLNDKKKVALLMWILGFVSFVAMFFVSRTNFVAIDVFTVLQGFFGMGGLVCIFAMAPDVTEYTQVKYGLRASGFIFAGINFFYKFGIAIVQGIVGLALANAGYVPNAAQSAGVQNLLWLFFTLIPAACLVFGVIAFASYKLTREEHNALVRKLA